MVSSHVVEANRLACHELQKRGSSSEMSGTRRSSSGTARTFISGQSSSLVEIRKLTRVPVDTANIERTVASLFPKIAADVAAPGKDYRGLALARAFEM